MISALDGPHVGVGLGMCLECRDAIPFEVQCCLVKPGRQEMVVSSRFGLTDELRECLGIARQFMWESHDEIVAKLGLETEAVGPRGLRKAKHDLHVYLLNKSGDIRHTSYMAAMVVAMVSLLIGRRPVQGMAVMGEVAFSGELNPSHPWDVEEVLKCREQGIRTVLTGCEVEIEESAKRRAAEVEEDGQPTLEILEFDSILDALPTLFGPIVPLGS